MDDANRILVTSGWFHGLKKLIVEYELTAADTAKIKAGLFALILAKVLEAKKEVTNLQMAIQQIEATCRSGMLPNPSTGLDAYGAAVNRLREQTKALDGWTISLLESDISILAAVENPETAGDRVKQLQSSFAELWNRRVDGWKPMRGFPELFDTMSISLP